MTRSRQPARMLRVGNTAWSFWQSTSTPASFLVLGGFAAMLLAAQGIVLFPLVVTDPEMNALANDSSLAHTFWMLRLVTIAAAPLILGMRALSFSALLHGALTLWGVSASWKPVFRGVLRAEMVLLAESMFATIILFWHAPTTLREAESLTLRAGLDLLWQPASSNLAALLVAANLFAIWWAWEIRIVLRRTTNLASAGANSLALIFGLLLVAIRTIAIRL